MTAYALTNCAIFRTSNPARRALQAVPMLYGVTTFVMCALILLKSQVALAHLLVAAVRLHGVWGSGACRVRAMQTFQYFMILTPGILEKHANPSHMVWCYVHLPSVGDRKHAHGCVQYVGGRLFG